jgi:hypothetical protein
MQVAQLIQGKGLAWNRKSVRIRNMDGDTETLLSLIEKTAQQLLAAAQRLRGNPKNPQPPQSAIDQAAAQKCLVCDGKKQPKNTRLKRGQCVNCYMRTMRRIRDGKLTETQLILAGKLLPAGVGGRRDSDFPLDAMTKDKSRVKKLLKNSKGKTTVQSNVHSKEGKEATTNS